MGHTMYGSTSNSVVNVTKAGGVVTLDLAHGNHFRWSGADATGAVTLAVANVPGSSTSAPTYVEWYLLLGAHSTAPTVTWTPVDVWIGGAAPTVGNSDVHHIRFWTYDGGTTIYAQAFE